MAWKFLTRNAVQTSNLIQIRSASRKPAMLLRQSVIGLAKTSNIQNMTRGLLS